MFFSCGRVNLWLNKDYIRKVKILNDTPANHIWEYNIMSHNTSQQLYAPIRVIRFNLWRINWPLSWHRTPGSLMNWRKRSYLLSWISGTRGDITICSLKHQLHSLQIINITCANHNVPLKQMYFFLSFINS